MDITRYWSCCSGKFLDKTGVQLDLLANNKLEFTGSIREWYETLQEVVIDCINDLQFAAFSKNGGAKRISINVYANKDAALFFVASTLLKPLPDDAVVPDLRSKPVGRISNYDVWEDQVLPTDIVRIVATFSHGENAETTMFGDVKIIDMP